MFGCKAYRLIRKELRASKFEAVSSEGVLVSFDQDNFNYQIYDLTSRKVSMSHDVTFDENTFPFQTTSPRETTLEPSLVKLDINFEDESDDDLGGVTPHHVDITTKIPSNETTTSTLQVPEVRAPTTNPDTSQVPVPVRVSSCNQNKRILYKGMCVIADEENLLKLCQLRTQHPNPSSQYSACTMERSG